MGNNVKGFGMLGLLVSLFALVALAFVLLRTSTPPKSTVLPPGINPNDAHQVSETVKFELEKANAEREKAAGCTIGEEADCVSGPTGQ